jgi:hypothetical protein
MFTIIATLELLHRVKSRRTLKDKCANVVLGKPNRPSSKERNMEDFFGDNEDDIAMRLGLH